jgi:hypothetical protein
MYCTVEYAARHMQIVIGEEVQKCRRGITPDAALTRSFLLYQGALPRSCLLLDGAE